MNIRVATYNIHKGVTGIRGRPRIHDVRQALQAIDADIVFLQEVQDCNERLAHHPDQPLGTQLEYLSLGTYAHRAYGMNAVYPHGHHGNAILSRHPIVKLANHDISDHVLEKRGLLHAVMRLGSGQDSDEVHLICLHLGLIKRSRLRQATFLADLVQREVPPDAPLIIAGDFNDWQQRVDGLLRARLGVEEVAVAARVASPAKTMLNWLLTWRSGKHPGAGVSRTFPSFAPWLTLDRIYVRGFEVLDMHVPNGLAWARCSDHAPLIAELKL